MKNLKGIFLFCGALGLGGLVACEDAQLITGMRGDGSTRVLKTCDVPLSFESVQPIFQARCKRCHEAGTRNSLATYQDILRLRNTVRDEVFHDEMPDDGPLAADQKVLLLAWLDAGAQENSSDVFACDRDTDGKAGTDPGSTPEPNPNPEPTPVTTPTPPPRVPRNVTYTELNAKIFDKKCLTCHIFMEPAEKYDFSSYAAIKSLTELYDTANPRNSRMILAVEKRGPGQMPPVRSRIAPLTPDEVQDVVDWIAGGFKE